MDWPGHTKWNETMESWFSPLSPAFTLSLGTPTPQPPQKQMYTSMGEGCFLFPKHDQSMPINLYFVLFTHYGNPFGQGTDKGAGT